jgi:hypothetical protein
VVAGKDSAEEGAERIAVLCWKTLLEKSKTDEKKKSSKEPRRTREKRVVTEIRNSSMDRNTIL